MLNKIKQFFINIWEKLCGFGRWIKNNIKKVLIGTAIAATISTPVVMDLTRNEISLEKVQQKYEQAMEIKAKYQLDGNSLVRSKVINQELDAYKKEPKDEVKVVIGDKDKTEFEPSIEIKRWNEVSFKIKPNMEGIATRDKDLAFAADKIIFTTPKISYEIYEYTNDEGGMKFIWYLNSKPVSNKIEFQIESSGLDFFYQPPLTQEYQNGYSEEFQKEIVVSETQVKDLEGNVLVERPENVVGSYAVYHSTKGGMNDAYGKDYKTGKAFHIYRPHLIDANGLEAWGNLHIENGIYSVEIPQNFLDKAVYPIKSNDTFGYESVGESGANWAENDVGLVEESRYGNPWSVNDGTLDLITWNCYHDGAGDDLVDFKMFVNQKDSVASGQHGQVANTSGSKTITTSQAWYSLNLGSEAISIANNYILSGIPDGETIDNGGGRVRLRISYDSGDMIYYESEADYSSPENPWVVDGQNYGGTDDIIFSIYATYTPVSAERRIIIVE